MNKFKEKALWENNQRLLCQKDILKRQLQEVKQTRKNIAELEAMGTAIKEVYTKRNLIQKNNDS